MSLHCGGRVWLGRTPGASSRNASRGTESTKWWTNEFQVLLVALAYTVFKRMRGTPFGATTPPAQNADFDDQSSFCRWKLTGQTHNATQKTNTGAFTEYAV